VSGTEDAAPWAAAEEALDQAHQADAVRFTVGGDGEARTITVTLTPAEYHGLQDAAGEAANGSPALAGAAALADAWSARTATPKVTVSVRCEVGGQWVTADVIGQTVRQLVDVLAVRLREAGEP
jgi:hypothetical protein